MDVDALFFFFFFEQTRLLDGLLTVRMIIRGVETRFCNVNLDIPISLATKGYTNTLSVVISVV